MGFSRLIVLLAIIWIGWLVYRRYQQSVADRLQKNALMKSSAESAIIVKCVTCGLHVPKNEAIEDKGKYYCSMDHKNL